MQVDPKINYLLNGLYKSTQNLIQTHLNSTQTHKKRVKFISCWQIVSNFAIPNQHPTMTDSQTVGHRPKTKHTHTHKVREK